MKLIPLLWAIPSVGSVCIFFCILHLDKPMVKDKSQENCQIPYDYCDLSIKSLEQEVRTAFKKADKYVEHLGKDKKELVDSLSNCDEGRQRLHSGLKLWSKRAEEIRISYSACNENLHICNEELGSCTDVLSIK